MGEVVIGLDGMDHFLGLVARLELDIDHTAVDTRACGDGHREGSVHPCDSLHGDGVPHAHTGAEVRIGDPLGDNSLHEGAHYGVAPWIPACSDDRDHPVLTSRLPQSLTQRQDHRVDIEAVDGSDTEG